MKFVVEQRIGAAVMLLQEVRNWQGGQGVLSGYELYTDLDVDTAIAVPLNYACNVCDCVFSKKYTFIVMFGTIWCSVHLPCHGDTSFDDLCLMLSEMEHVVITLRRRHHTSKMVFGCDLNVSLAPNLEGLTGSRIHPNANSAPARWREAVMEWMHSLRLRAACTFECEDTFWNSSWDYGEKWTHENSNKGGRYQLDYLLVSNYVRGKASVVRGYDLGSDHRPIDANLRLKEMWGTTERMEHTQKGWSTRNVEANSKFMKGVANDLCWTDNKARGKNLLTVEEIIYSHAVSVDSDNMAIRQWNNLQDHRKRLEDLRNSLRQEIAKDIRKEIRRDIRKEVAAKVRKLKGDQLDRLISGYFDRGKQSFEMQLPDGPSTNRQDWAAAAHKYGCEKYCDKENDETAQRERLIRLQELALREIEAGWQPPVVKFHDFLNALASAKNCKQPGSDGVVTEMVRALSWTTLLWLYLLFLVRLGGWETEKPEAWKEVILTAIPKKTDKSGLQSMRYISLLPVLQKFYIRALQTAVRRERKPHETNILGYEPGRSTAGVTATLRQILEKATEWGVGAFVASADVEGAFDCIRHMDIERALLQKGVHPSSICALLRESSELKGRINLPGAPMSSSFAYDRGARQGSVEGPDMWNQVLDCALREPAARWEAEGIGFKLAPNIEEKGTGEPTSEMIRKAKEILYYIISAGQMTCMPWRDLLSISFVS